MIKDNMMPRDKVLALHENMPLEDLKRRILRRNLIEGISKELSKLPHGKRLLFSMYFIHGYRICAIACLCDVCEGTISRRLKRIGNELLGNITNKSQWRNKSGQQNPFQWYRLNCL